MDLVSQSWYDVVFERDFLKRKGNAFQDFFCEIMEKCHPGDFIRVRPWGNVGDRKNDGYLKSQRTLFQVYGPNEPSLYETLKKIDEDFNGALPYWQDYFDTWVFVHNSRSGIAPDVTEKLLALEKASGITVTNWGYEELRKKAFSCLSEADLASLLGPAPSTRDVLRVGYEQLKLVLKGIERQEPPLGQEVRPVPPDKLEYNRLSASVDGLLRAGMKKASLVGQFFRDWIDPTYGQEIVAAFSAEYQRLRQRRVPPDEIFMSLLEFAGGAGRGSADHEAGVLAVLAHLFETCDIFEEPPKGVIS